MNRKFQMSNVKFLNRYKTGQLLVEVIISVGLIAILIAAVVPLVLSSANASLSQSKGMVASMLAKEEIEAANAIKQEDWNSIYDVTKGVSYHPEIVTNKWQLATDVETINLNNVNYTRSLMIENVNRSGINGAGEITDIGYDDPSTQKITASVTGFGGAPITISQYLSRWVNQNISQTDWTGGQYTSATDIDTSVAGQVQLAKSGAPATGNYGNRFLLDSFTDLQNLSSVNARSSLRFTAQKTGIVSSLQVYIQTARNSGDIYYQYGLQADNAGQPTDVYLSSGTAIFDTTGWKTINLSSPLNITAGTVYHLVVRYASGTTPNNGHYIALRRSLPLNLLVVQNGASDSNQNTLTNSSGSWVLLNAQPIYVLGFNDNTYEGNPYDSSEARSIYGANYEGEKFKVASDTTINALNLYLSKNHNQDPADDLYFTLRDLTDNIDLINTNFINGAGLTTDYAWKTYNFPSDLTLTANHDYRLSFFSPSSAPNRYYRIFNASNPDVSDYNDINWDGINSVVSRSTDSGSSWTESDFIDLAGYNFITVEVSNYVLSGNLISSTSNLGHKVGFNRIYWDQTLPANTNVKFQLAANNDNADPWQFLGPDGTETDYYDTSSGENILSALSNNRYLRYKVILETTDPAQTPILNEVRINYSP